MNVVYLAASTPASTDMDIILLPDAAAADDDDEEEGGREDAADVRAAIVLKKPLRPAVKVVVMPSTDAAPTTTPSRLVLSPLLHIAAAAART